MQISVSRDDDQLFTDIEGFEYELVHGEITDSEMEMISKRAFEKASSENDLSSHFMDAILSALQYMGLIPENLPAGNGGKLPSVYGDGHRHYMEFDEVLEFINSEIGIEIKLTSFDSQRFVENFDLCIDGACQYSDLIDNAMLDSAVDLGYARRDEDE